MIRKARLCSPGPTPLSPAVQEALSRPILHHRTEEFRSLFKECTKGLRAFLRSDDDVLILAASGTGAMEAALVNVLAPGDPMLAMVAGKFGQRWVEIGNAYGMDVRSIEAPLGEAVSPSAVEEMLDAEPRIRAVFVQQSESSTGVAHDVEALARLVRSRPDTLLVVDSISGAGAIRLETSAWGVDVLLSASQKSLSLPPGLAFLSVGRRAWERIERSKTPRFYFDLRRERESQAEGDSRFTPAISLVVALKAALDQMVAQGGVEALVENASTLAAMTRAAAQALGLPLVAPRDHGNAVTALFPPMGVEATALMRALKHEFGSTVAGGQGRLKGKIFRIAHLGYYDVTDLLGLLGTLELSLRRVGYSAEIGSGVSAAAAEYLKRHGSDTIPRFR